MFNEPAFNQIFPTSPGLRNCHKPQQKEVEEQCGRRKCAPLEKALSSTAVFLSICVPNRCSNPSVSQRRFLRKFLAGLQISQPWGPATKLLRTIQVQGFPQTRFSIQQLLSTEVHTCGRVDLVPRRHCRPCATRTKSCRFAYRLFGQTHSEEIVLQYSKVVCQQITLQVTTKNQ